MNLIAVGLLFLLGGLCFAKPLAGLLGADAQTLAGTILNDYGTIANTEMLGQVKLGDLNAYGVNGATVQKQLEAYLIQTADGCVSVVLCRAGTAPAGWYESLLASAQTLQITG